MHPWDLASACSAGRQRFLSAPRPVHLPRRRTPRRSSPSPGRRRGRRWSRTARHKHHHRIALLCRRRVVTAAVIGGGKVIEVVAPATRPPLSRAPALHHGQTTPLELCLGRPASIGPCVAPTTTTRGLRPKYQRGSTSSPRSRRRFTPGRRVDGTTHQLRPRNRRDFSPLGATSPLTPARHDGTVGGRRHTFL